MTVPPADTHEAEGLAELVAPLIAAWEGFKQPDANMEQAYYRLAKHQWSNWEALAAALSAAPKREG